MALVWSCIFIAKAQNAKIRIVKSLPEFAASHVLNPPSPPTLEHNYMDYQYRYDEKHKLAFFMLPQDNNTGFSLQWKSGEKDISVKLSTLVEGEIRDSEFFEYINLMYTQQDWITIKLKPQEYLGLHKYNNTCIGVQVKVDKPSTPNVNIIVASFVEMNCESLTKIATEVLEKKDYVDLGLPSGTWWKKENESNFISFNTAWSNYGDKLPTKEQIRELIRECSWKWVGSGYQVTGPNGNSIMLPYTGYYTLNGMNPIKNDIFTFYWSSTRTGKDQAWCLGISDESTHPIYVLPFSADCLVLVRLVQKF